MGKKRKIAILQNGLYWGGTDTFVINLCKGLDKEKFDITVINPSTGEGQRENEILESGVKLIHTFPTVGLKGRLLHLWSLYKILRKGKFDVFHTNIDLFNGPNLLVAWLARVPLRICHSHNSLQSKELKEGRTIIVRIYQNTMRWLCWKFSNRRIGCSLEANNFLYKNRFWNVNHYPTIIFNGIDLNKFKLELNKEDFKNSNGFTAPYHIITIGHLIEQKNPLFIANLFNKICEIREDIDLIWVGDGKYKNEVIKILNEKGNAKRVHFLSKRTDIPELLKVSDIFILPSNFEGLGIVAIEAQASGLPVLLSDKVPELADCGGAKFLPIDRGTEEWVRNMNDILNGDLELIPENRKLALFSIQNMINQITEVFET